jgi:glycosyltransferase involved in cell wall biosynthesis
VFSVRAAYQGMCVKQLRHVEYNDLIEFPKLSIIVAARNEERVIERDLDSLLKVDYPDIEFIVVDDRSTDKTGEIIHRFAAKDSRIKPICIETLPPGWLGKVNALNIGTQAATGDWLLYTDADIRFERESLKRAIGYVEDEQLDHLTVLPDDRTQSDKFLVPLFVIAFGAMFLVRTRVRKLREEGSSAFIGVGAFNLVRRTAFEKTPGFVWLKMEVIDDVGLGLMLKNAGARSAVLGGQELLSFEWYRNLPEAIKGLEKNAFAGFAGYSYLRGIATTAKMCCITLLPFIAALAFQNLSLLVIAVLLYFVIPYIIGILFHRTIQVKPILVAFIPLGYFFVSLAIANSIVAVWKEGGIRWRNTFYPLEELQKGRRVKL